MITADEAKRLSQLPKKPDLDSMFELYCVRIRELAEKKQRQARLTIPTQLKSEFITRFRNQGFDVKEEDYETIVEW